MTIKTASNLRRGDYFEPQVEAYIDLINFSFFYINMIHPNYICIEDFVMRINAIMCMYYIRTIWLKV